MKHSWRWYTYLLTLLCCGQFLFITLLAMLLYPGSTADDPTTQGYTFTQNFFSDLGMTETYSGQANVLSAVLFFVALTAAGLGIIAYFLAFPHFFRNRRLSHYLSLGGSLFGVVTGFGYIGVAFTPANLLLDPHVAFVYLAFVAFFIAALFYTLAIFTNPTYPKTLALIFLAFTFALASYILLIFTGPDLDTLQGLTLQATAQKLIVYAALICMLIQSFAAWRLQNAQELHRSTQPGRSAAI